MNRHGLDHYSSPSSIMIDQNGGGYQPVPFPCSYLKCKLPTRLDDLLVAKLSRCLKVHLISKDLKELICAVKIQVSVGGYIIDT